MSALVVFLIAWVLASVPSSLLLGKIVRWGTGE